MDVRETLGYADSDHFVSSEQIDQLAGSELAFALRLALKECSQLGEQPGDSSFAGAYVLSNSRRPNRESL